MRAGAAPQGRGVCQVARRMPRRMPQRERCRQANSITPHTRQAGMASSLKKLALNRIGGWGGEKRQREVNKP